MARYLYTTFAAFISLLLPSQLHAAGSHSYNGLALTPQMGWDNWNAFACDINETLLLNTAQKIVDYGYAHIWCAHIAEIENDSDICL